MFAVIYRFKLQPHQETDYQHYWHTLATYFIKERGAIGSCLHKGEDGLWVAYSRWPDKATRDASWSDNAVFNEALPQNIRDIIGKMYAIKEENSALKEYDEIPLEIIDDLLCIP